MNAGFSDHYQLDPPVVVVGWIDRLDPTQIPHDLLEIQSISELNTRIYTPVWDMGLKKHFLS